MACTLCACDVDDLGRWRRATTQADYWGWSLDRVLFARPFVHVGFVFMGDRVQVDEAV